MQLLHCLVPNKRFSIARHAQQKIPSFEYQTFRKSRFLQTPQTSSMTLLELEGLLDYHFFFLYCIRNPFDRVDISLLFIFRCFWNVSTPGGLVYCLDRLICFQCGYTAVLRLSNFMTEYWFVANINLVCRCMLLCLPAHVTLKLVRITAHPKSNA